MATYLLVWNPKKYLWDQQAQLAERVRSNRRVTERWSCGRNKHIRRHDRVFLMRLGKEPKGILASGHALSGSEPGPHWDAELRRQRKRAVYVHLQFDVLLDPARDPILSRNSLKARFPGMHWDTQASGVEIPSEVAAELEVLWREFGYENVYRLPEEVDEPVRYFEGAVRSVLVDRYERNARARSECLDRFGTDCWICGFRFDEAYGLPARSLVHVHHLRPLSEIGEEYEVDPVEDLRPLCPNCHAVVHSRNPAYGPEEVVAMLRERRAALSGTARS